MASFDFSEIRIVDDTNHAKDVIKEIIESKNQSDPFHVLDVGKLVARHKLWLEKIPRVVPHYVVKCNPDPCLIKILSALNANFDCTSKQEIIDVMRFGVTGDRIIYANPVKSFSHINFARKVGVLKTTADSQAEMMKIKDHYPEAMVVIHIRCDAPNPATSLSLKFGCDPDIEAIELIQLAKNLGLNLHGFSFHVGSPCADMSAFTRGIKTCNELINYAKSIGCDHACLIDIGDGFPGENDPKIEKFATVINEAIKNIDPSIKFISELGRYYVTAAITAAANIFGKRKVMEDDKVIQMYYVNDGVYGSFIEELVQVKARQPITSLNGADSKQRYLSTIWGPTCDSYDCIVKNVLLPDFNLDDWLIWEDMGAYTTSCSTHFNGFCPPKIFPFIRRSDWRILQAGIHDVKNNARMGSINGQCEDQDQEAR